jgi:excisionase family DNA binding protein
LFACAIERSRIDAKGDSPWQPQRQRGRRHEPAKKRDGKATERKRRERRMVPRLGYSIDEACEAVGKSRSFIYEQIRLGNLRAQRQGKRVFITAENLKAYVDSLAALPARDA